MDSLMQFSLQYNDENADNDKERDEADDGDDEELFKGLENRREKLQIVNDTYG